MVFSFTNVLADWETLGVFDYLLPFLLIFAIVYGILTATNVFSGNKGVNTVIAIAVGLLSLRFDYVRVFFSEVFPRLGVGIAVLVVLMILTAVFIPKQWLKGWSGSMWGVSAIIGIVVIYKSFDYIGWNISGYGWWDQYGSLALLGMILVALIVWIVIDKGDWKNSDKSPAEFAKFRN